MREAIELLDAEISRIRDAKTAIEAAYMDPEKEEHWNLICLVDSLNGADAADLVRAIEIHLSWS